MNEAITLTLTDMANGGQALGRYNEKTIFVPYAIPGEEITARIVDDRGRYAFAEGITVLDPSADRVLPVCPHFGLHQCGGCQWQHIDYDAQLALKTDIVVDQLERIGGFTDAEVGMTLASPQWNYRHEAILYPHPAGKTGFLSTDGKTPFLIDECHILTPELLELLRQLDLELPTLTQIILRDNGAGDLMVMLSTSDDNPPSLELDLGASVNFLLNDGEAANLIGATHLRYELLGESYRVTAGSFLRANPPQIETLMRLVRDWLVLSGNECILDLYAGVGLFSAVLASDASLITCVDHFPPAMTDAEENLSAFDHINVIEGDVEEILYSIPDDEVYDIAILDPPVGGLNRDVMDALESVLPPRLIYIGDDPATLARDAKRLHERYGYTLDAVQPVDFEPQTFRVVSVAHLHRGEERTMNFQKRLKPPNILHIGQKQTGILHEFSENA